MKEFGVPDMVKSMSWCGENICLGIRREYMILNSTNGALSEIFPSGRLAPPLVVSLPTGQLLLGKVFFYISYNNCFIWLHMLLTGNTSQNGCVLIFLLMLWQ